MCRDVRVTWQSPGYTSYSNLSTDFNSNDDSRLHLLHPLFICRLRLFSARLWVYLLELCELLCNCCVISDMKLTQISWSKNLYLIYVVYYIPAKKFEKFNHLDSDINSFFKCLLDTSKNKNVALKYPLTLREILFIYIIDLYWLDLYFIYILFRFIFYTFKISPNFSSSLWTSNWTIRY